MGASGCGKSTLLRSMIGLLHPSAGDIRYDGRAFWATEEGERSKMQRHFGVLFQSGALWSSLTLAENVGLPLSLYTPLGSSDIAEIVSLKLSLVGLRGFEDTIQPKSAGHEGVRTNSRHSSGLASLLR
jgi:phospholipid/cholesterol/gamma-HCH transport system ATP-binding protein